MGKESVLPSSDQKREGIFVPVEGGMPKAFEQQSVDEMLLLLWIITCCGRGWDGYAESRHPKSNPSTRCSCSFGSLFLRDRVGC